MKTPEKRWDWKTNLFFLLGETVTFQGETCETSGGGDDFQIRVEFQLFLLFDTGLSFFFFLNVAVINRGFGFGVILQYSLLKGFHFECFNWKIHSGNLR